MTRQKKARPRGPNRLPGLPPDDAVGVTAAARQTETSNSTIWQWIRDGAPYWFRDELVRGRDSGHRLHIGDLLAWREKSRGRERKDEERDAEEAKLAEVVARIGSAQRYEELGEVARDIGALVLSGQITASAGQTATAALREARQALRAHKESDTGEADLSLLPVDADAVELVTIYQGIICDKRRARILKSAKRAAAKDIAEHPLPDTTQRAEGA